MKKKILLGFIALVLTLSIVLTGCGGASGVPQADYDNLAAQLADCQSKLTKAQNDLSDMQAQKSAADANLQAAQSQVANLQQQVADLQEQVDEYDFTGLTKAQIAEKIVQNYKATHFYEKDVYDCNNMASDVWDMLKFQGITSVIVVGSIQYTITDILQSDHAWVLADVGNGAKLALDATNGQAYTKAEDSRYYRGWSFADPAALKANDDLKIEYNTRVSFINALVTEINAAMTLYNNSSTQAEADKWLALYNKLKDIKTAQETLATNVLNQINQLATQFNYN